tara:strand:+ start:3847 stop:4140 length:294 start_codon:yes stop_codon:yes gene_type:complete
LINRSLKKIHLTKNLSSKSGFSLNHSKKLINDLVEILIDTIRLNKLNLKNLGSFQIIYKNQRVGRNPKTKEEFIISSRRVIKFIAAKKLINSLNKLS